MSKLTIQSFRQQDGTDILKVMFNDDSYFYCYAENEDIVRDMAWNKNCQDYIQCNLGIGSLSFHRALALKQGYDINDMQIDHINRVRFDNCDCNLIVATPTQNCRNKKVRRYKVLKGYNDGFYYKPCIVIDKFVIHPYSAVRTELTACLLQNAAEKNYYSDYNYDFLKDRYHDEDILDLERTGKISIEEGTYRHVCRRALNNAYLYYRYGLEDYFFENKLPVPEFTIDELGRLVDKSTNKLSAESAKY